MAITAKLSSGTREARKATTPAKPDREQPSDEEFLGMLGKVVRQTRAQRGMARKVLAEAADVSERYLAQLESGDGNVSVILLRRVAAALNLRITHLLGYEVSPRRAQLNSLVDSLPEQRLEEVMNRLVHDFGTDENVRRKRIALIGLRGAGKSTLGSALAKTMRRPFVELDREIEQEAGMPLSEIFMLYGQSGYRSFERQCIERVIDSQTDVVMSVGGGIVSDTETYQFLLSNCFTVWIKASPSEHMSRVVAQGDLRPMRGHARAMEHLQEILAAREPQYSRADATIDTSRQTVNKSLALLQAATMTWSK
jgi:XRE family transcriptional regulator, aerobic/anaerobic benzoate catabolism transcriptional regulator